MACKSFYHVRYHSSTLRNDGQMFTSMGRPDKTIILRMRGLQPKAPDADFKFPVTATMAYCFPKVRMDGHNLFHQMAESDQNKRMVPYKRKMALSFGRLHIPFSMPLLKVQSSD